MVGDPHIPHNNYWDLECPCYSLGHLLGLPVLSSDRPRLLPVSKGITHIPSMLPLFPVPFWPYLDGLLKRYHSLDVSGHHHSSRCSLTTWSPGIFMFVLGSPVSTSSASQWFTSVLHNHTTYAFSEIYCTYLQPIVHQLWPNLLHN